MSDKEDLQRGIALWADATVNMQDQIANASIQINELNERIARDDAELHAKDTEIEELRLRIAVAVKMYEREKYCSGAMKNVLVMRMDKLKKLLIDHPEYVPNGNKEQS